MTMTHEQIDPLEGWELHNAFEQLFGGIPAGWPATLFSFNLDCVIAKLPRGEGK